MKNCEVLGDCSKCGKISQRTSICFKCKGVFCQNCIIGKREKARCWECESKKKIDRIINSIKDTNHFKQALTHSSYCNENNSDVSYERLEFLGDEILNFYTYLFIYQNFPDFAEGKMSKLKQLMVQESTLAHLSGEIRLNRMNEDGKLEYLKLGEGEMKNGGADKSSILADIFESFIASLYLEKGGKIVYRFLSLTVFAWVKGKENMIWDYKSYLQEYCQQRKNRIRYQSKGTKRAKDNRVIFIREVSDELGTFREQGEGCSKDEAEKEAAAKAIKKLGIGEEENG